MIENIAGLTGFPVDQVRYLSLFALSYPLAAFFLMTLRYGSDHGEAKNTVRHVYSAGLGILFCYWCFGIAQLLVLVLFVAVGYLLLVKSPIQNVHLISFFYTMTCIFVAHLYRLWNDFGSYNLDFTGPFMLIVIRVSYVGFSYYDGVAKKENELLNNDQRLNRICRLPTVLEYFSYNFCFLTILAGPACTYNEYIQMITGENFQIKSFYGKGQQKPPNPLLPVLKKFALAVLFLGMYVFLTQVGKFQELIFEESTPFHIWIVYVTVFTFSFRCKYYFIFLISESISNTGGLGFYYEDKKHKWDLVRNIDIWNYEFGTNTREKVVAWNITTQTWLRRVVYERPIFSSISSVLWTYMISTWWHGLHPAYLMCFLYLGIATVAARKVRQLLWERFQSPRHVKISYDILTTTISNFFRDFAILTVADFSMESCFQMWRSYYYLPPIILVLCIVVLPTRKKSIKKL